MRSLRKIHLYLGCVFAPLIIYFSLSGAWQLFRWNDLPKNSPPSAMQTVLHALSAPHTHSTLPGSDPKTESSLAFAIVACLMGVGLIATTAIGIVLAFRSTRSRWIVSVCLGVGVVIPIALLFLR